jgi:hypothetical protein
MFPEPWPQTHSGVRTPPLYATKLRRREWFPESTGVGRVGISAGDGSG